MNKFIVLVSIFLMVGCKSAQPKIQTTKKAQTMNKTVYKKPTVKKQMDDEIVIDVPKNSETEILEATSKIKVTTEIVKAYIDNFKESAKNNMQKNGIPASITLAQGILESGAGTGDLAMQANNHFGIKCHKEWTGPSVKHDDDSAQECFRKYQYPEESFRDHSYFLTSRPRYSSLFKLPKNDYKSWARGLKNAGYATDVKYPDKLIGLIERYQLHQYDAEVLGLADLEKAMNPIENNIKIPMEYTIEKGDTLYSLSKKFNITVEELKIKNKLVDNTLSLGQNIIVK